MLIACKFTPLSKTLDYDINSEPPYLVITLKFEPTSHWGQGEELTTKPTLFQVFLMWFAFLCSFNQF